MKKPGLKKSPDRLLARVRHVNACWRARAQERSSGETGVPSAEDIAARIKILISDRAPRRVVTPQGNRATGHFPCLKCYRANFDSLVEADALRVLEVAPSVLVVETHPWVLRLVDPSTGRAFSYTPDLAAVRYDTLMLLEVKGDYWLTQPSAVSALKRNSMALRHHGIPFALLLESDLRIGGLQEDLSKLLKARPVVGRARESIDAAQWDPLGRSHPSGEILRQWREAQKTCDALLDRVMRRDPDEVISSAAI